MTKRTSGKPYIHRRDDVYYAVGMLLRKPSHHAGQVRAQRCDLALQLSSEGAELD